MVGKEPCSANAEAAVKKKWTSRSIGSGWQHSIFYLLIRFGGRRCAYVLLAIVALYYVILRPSVQKRSSYYLKKRFLDHSLLERILDSYHLTLGVGKILVDRAVLGIVGPDALNIRLTGRECLSQLLAEGHGLILVTAHVGCWQLAMSSLKALNTEVSILMHREDGDLERHAFEHTDMRAPYRIIDPVSGFGGTLEMLEVLKRGEVLCIMGDRVMGSERNTLKMNFLENPIKTPYSPYLLASASEAPLAVVLSYQDEKGDYEINVERVIRVPKQLGRNSEAYRPYAQEFISELENFVMKHPYQFFNFYDMWSDISAGDNSKS